MRVLIVKTSSMGDVIHALPAISDMARAIPGIQIDWLVENSFSAIAARHRDVARVIPIQWRKWRKSLGDPKTCAAVRAWRKDMGQTRYDLVLDLQGLLKSALFASFAKGARAGYDWRSIREPLASMLYQRRASVPKTLHAIDRCRRLCAQSLGYALPSTPPDFGLQAAPQGWTPSSGAPFAALIPCASRPEKLWPQSDWIAVGQSLKARGWQVAVMWGNAEERRLAESIAEAVGGSVPPFLTVTEIADTLAKADIVVGLDTGMSHIAAAHGRPTVGIYCDHEPGLAGLVGSGPVASLGGKRRIPALGEVLAAIDKVLTQQR